MVEREDAEGLFYRRLGKYGFVPVKDKGPENWGRCTDGALVYLRVAGDPCSELVITGHDGSRSLIARDVALEFFKLYLGDHPELLAPQVRSPEYCSERSHLRSLLFGLSGAT
jgi:hypothetical protein